MPEPQGDEERHEWHEDDDLRQGRSQQEEKKDEYLAKVCVSLHQRSAMAAAAPNETSSASGWKAVLRSSVIGLEAIKKRRPPSDRFGIPLVHQPCE
jgi:hypothetical protein